MISLVVFYFIYSYSGDLITVFYEKLQEHISIIFNHRIIQEIKQNLASLNCIISRLIANLKESQIIIKDRKKYQDKIVIGKKFSSK
ncbi:hypothetical protein BpHYR1_035641 [Brachionus plicatilis]|uniref:Uncharacterized protein n=1 Tax=Brachionus plicatilis TaxID=10195 RepID=A0A3M7RQ42_BRAPC|nr:hypothetical protein BpHYR1_035641 [Brachionus plicatilis]